MMRNTLSFCILLVVSMIAGFADEQVPKLYEESFALEAQGDYSGAANKVLQILRADPKDYTAYLRAGWLFYLQADYNSSVTCYKKAIALQPDAVEPLLGITLPLMASKQWKEAEKMAKAVVQKDPNSYLGNSRLAYTMFCLGKYTESKEKYEQVLSLYPSDLDMKLGLGWVYFRLGNKRKAAEYFGEVLRVQKNNASALEGLEMVRKM